FVVDAFDVPGRALRVGLTLALAAHLAGLAWTHGYFFGRWIRGSTGVPRRRISKYSFTRLVPVLPMAAILCPALIALPSCTNVSAQCAYALRKSAVCLMIISWPYPRSPLPWYTTRPSAAAYIGWPSSPAIAIPLLPSSGAKRAISVPFAGQRHDTGPPASAAGARAARAGAGGDRRRRCPG